jgi:hypothetical protein
MIEETGYSRRNKTVELFTQQEVSPDKMNKIIRNKRSQNGKSNSPISNPPNPSKHQRKTPLTPRTP